jgi:hypothetical protein
MSALFGALCFVVLAPATEFNLWDYMLTDPLSFFLLTASMACAIHRKWLSMFAFCILLSFSKELALPAAVFAVLWSLETRDNAGIRWSRASLIGSLLVLGLLRYLIHPSSAYSVMEQFKSIYRPFSFSNVENRLRSATEWTWYFLLPLGLLQLFTPPYVLRRPSCIVFLILIMSQLLIAGDIDRVIDYGFPVVVAACACQLDYFIERRKIVAASIGAFVLLAQAGIWLSYGKFIDPKLATSREVNSILLILTLGVLLLGLFSPLLRRRGFLRPATA